MIWVVSAYCRETKKVVRFSVGSRCNKTLNGVLITLQLSETKKIYTDQLKHYRYLISKSIHKTKHFGTNHVERMHLNYRTHLKRLNRRSICFSRSVFLLFAVLKIYLWG